MISCQVASAIIIDKALNNGVFSQNLFSVILISLWDTTKYKLYIYNSKRSGRKQTKMTQLMLKSFPQTPPTGNLSANEHTRYLVTNSWESWDYNTDRPPFRLRVKIWPNENSADLCGFIKHKKRKLLDEVLQPRLLGGKIFFSQSVVSF